MLLFNADHSFPSHISSIEKVKRNMKKIFFKKSLGALDICFFLMHTIHSLLIYPAYERKKKYENILTLKGDKKRWLYASFQCRLFIPLWYFLHRKVKRNMNKINLERSRGVFDICYFWILQFFCFWKHICCTRE